VNASRRPVDPDRSVDPDLLADFVGGALDGTPEAAEVRHLIESDPAWAGSYADVAAADAAVRAELTALGPATEAMPADVLARLDRALADAAAPHPAPDVADLGARRSQRSGSSSRTVGALSSARRWGGRRALATAAAVLVCGAGSIVAVPLLRGGAAEDTAASGLPGVAAERGAAPAHAPDAAGITVLASGRDHRPETLRQTRLSAGQADAQAQTSQFPSPDVMAGAAGAPPSAGWLSQDHGPAGGASLPAAAVPAELSRLAQPTAREACLGALAARYGGRATVMDYARFQGRPAVAVLIVDSDLGGSGQTLVVVVGPACGADSAGLDELYHGVA